MTFSHKVEKALEKARTLAEVDWIEDKVLTHPNRPNYRTKEGREIRDNLLNRCNERGRELQQNENPF